MKVQELFTKTEGEIKTLLQDNKYIKPGALVLNKTTTAKDPKILEVVARKDGKVVDDNFKCWNLNDLELFTFKKYLQIKDVYIKSKLKLKTIEQFVRILNSSISKLYKEENYEIIQISSYTVQLIIYYPELKITNEHEMSHIMTDCYITHKFEFDRGHIYYRKLKLFRGTYSVGEYNNNYMFSHTSRSYFGTNTGSFCFGDTEIKDLYYAYSDGMTIFQIIPFILTIEQYFQWESLDGGPYRRMSAIKNYNIVNQEVNSYHNEIITNDCYNEVLEKIDNFRYDLNDSNISLNNESKTLIKDILSNYINLKGYNDLIGREINDNFGQIQEFTKEDIKDANRNMSKVDFKFKGKTLNSKVVKTKSSDDISKLNELYPLTIYPQLVNKIVNRLQTEFKEYIHLNKLNIL